MVVSSWTVWCRVGSLRLTNKASSLALEVMSGRWGRRGGHRGYHGGGHRGNRGGGRGGKGGQRDREEGHGERSWGPPAGLKGRDIGMWYAQRGKARKAEAEKKSRAVVDIDHQKERHLQNLLHQIKSNDEIPPQPARSYAFPDDSEQASEEASKYGTKAEKMDYIDQTHESYNKSTRNKDNDWSRTWERASDRLDLTKPSTSSANEDLVSLNPANQKNVTDINADDDEAMDVDVTEYYHYLEERGDFDTDFERHKEMKIEEKYESIGGDRSLDEKYLEEFEAKQSLPGYQKMMKTRQKLPAYDMRETIVDLIEQNQVVVISGETGCGKTTQVTQFILDHYISQGKGSKCRVVCTQPRRISAISVAERVADERDESLGHSVGYSIRLDSKLGRGSGSILYCTTGIMLRWLETDKWLSTTTHVILDEIHERDLQSDFLMIILKDLIAKRPDLKLVLMSATLNAEMFSKYFNNCPMINIPGFTYPVKEYLFEDIVELLGYSPDPSQRNRKPFRGKKGYEQHQKIQREMDDYDSWVNSLKNSYSTYTVHTLRHMEPDPFDIDLNLIKELIKHIVHNGKDGAILVFLPGWADIKNLNQELEKDKFFIPDRFRVIPLHSMMPTVNQKEVFNEPPPGVRKIVIATNIAETSITINDVVYVIDGGKIKLSDYDAESNIATLKAEWVSLANARQRRGRAGRVQPGECYHLYTKFREERMSDYQLPEMLRMRLEDLCLQIKILKLGLIEPFVLGKAMQPPSQEALHNSIQMLRDLNALDQYEDLTPLGFHLARLPVDPHTGKMILFGAMFGCLDPVLTVAATLSFKDPFYMPMGKEAESDRARQNLAADSKSDHIMLINAMDGWMRAEKRGNSNEYCWRNFLSKNTLRMLVKMKKQFAELLCTIRFLKSTDPLDPAANIHSRNINLVKAVICAGLYPNVAKVEAKVHHKKISKRPPKIFTKPDGRVYLHPKSVNAQETEFESRWLVYHMKMKTQQLNVFDCSMVSPYPLLFFGGDIKTKQEAGENLISVDEWIIFKASPNIASIVQDLRSELDKLLEDKITHPGVTNWDPKSKEGAIMQAIIDLITTDDFYYRH